MSLFRGENPALGSNTVVSQAGATGLDVKIPVYGDVESFGPLGATTTSFTAFIADGAYKLEKVLVVFGTASTSGTLQLEKATGTQAVGSGTSLLQATISLAGTANTVQDSSTSGAAFAPVTNVTTTTLAKGDRVNFIFAGTMTSLANCAIQLYLSRA